MDLAQIEAESKAVVEEVCELAKLKEGNLLVIGCSSSTVQGELIGTHSSMDIAGAVFRGAWQAVQERRLRLAVQCCEHLNRALVTDRDTMEKYGFEQVNVIPQPKAGGSFATTYYQTLQDPVMVENTKAGADAGIDIGGVLIGMHVKPVVVPLKITHNRIGEAIVIAARRRPKFVGGGRAVYDEALE
ncbi:MAG: TIGR01440 family protein [Lachnospiraceae bacterium]|nr:TIGR01440 family protein [Lachnospiraceae bacterium]